jgi:hypothetical protein
VPLGSTGGNVLPIKRVVQVNAGGGSSSSTSSSSNAPVASLLSSSPNRSLTASSLSNVTLIEKSPNKIITSINSNANGGNASSNNSSSAMSNSGSKIQYVKIVNMSSMNSSNNGTNPNVTLSASSANSTGFKITTINANNGSAANSQVKISWLLKILFRLRGENFHHRNKLYWYTGIYCRFILRTRILLLIKNMILPKDPVFGTWYYLSFFEFFGDLLPISIPKKSLNRSSYTPCPPFFGQKSFLFEAVFSTWYYYLQRKKYKNSGFTRYQIR